jgi:hypothetical protein
MATISMKIEDEMLAKFDATLPSGMARSEGLRRLMAAAAGEFSVVKVAAVTADEAEEINAGEPLAGNFRLPSIAEIEALGVAIGLFNFGAKHGGKVGFRAEQECLHQYADFAETLGELREKLTSLGGEK